MTRATYTGPSQARRLGLVGEIEAQLERVHHQPLRVLDAGAGRALKLEFPPDTTIAGIDLSEKALSSHPDLDERIVGDLETYAFAPNSFDVIVCWDVLEHLSNPLAAVKNMIGALASGGMLVIGGPNVWSPKSLVAKFTPHSFHVLVYKRLLHMPDAGKPGYAPFPTYLRLVTAPRRLAGASRELGLEVVMLKFYGGIAHRLPPFLRQPWNALHYLLRFVPFGLHMADSDFCIVLRRPGAAAGP